MKLLDIITNPLLLVFISIALGQLLGRIEVKNFKLGSSGGLFVGIIVSYWVTKCLQSGVYDTVAKSVTISSDLFKLSLISFIASVGLLAAKSIRTTIKNNGCKFLILAFTITFTGALSTWTFANICIPEYRASIIGTYVGALTSSPGLATAIEVAKSIFTSGEAMVGLGYSISYVPGVILVILFAQILAKTRLQRNMQTDRHVVSEDIEIADGDFSVVGYFIVCFIGVLIGSVDMYLGKHIGFFSLGSTGGVLISALILGDIGKIAFISFNMNRKGLAVIRDLSLNMFITIVGLKYGYTAVNLVKTSGIQLLGIGAFTGAMSILAGYLVGSKLLKLDPILLMGGICGGMTSTPGLAASIEATKTDEVAVGYGATYPFALLFMILFTNILCKL